MHSRNTRNPLCTSSNLETRSTLRRWSWIFKLTTTKCAEPHPTTLFSLFFLFDMIVRFNVVNTSVINDHFGFNYCFALDLPTLFYNFGDLLLLLVLLCLLVTHYFHLVFLEGISFFEFSLLYLELL